MAVARKRVIYTKTTKQEKKEETTQHSGRSVRACIRACACVIYLKGITRKFRNKKREIKEVGKRHERLQVRVERQAPTTPLNDDNHGHEERSARIP
jgi:hypothetical protein